MCRCVASVAEPDVIIGATTEAAVSAPVIATVAEVTVTPAAVIPSEAVVIDVAADTCVYDAAFTICEPIVLVVNTPPVLIVVAPTVPTLKNPDEKLIAPVSAVPKSMSFNETLYMLQVLT